MELFKFRAKAINREPDREYRTDYKNGDWVYGLITDFGNKDYTLPAQMTNENGVSNIDVDIDTFGQFTGLYDKNGKDIYDGDILKYNQLFFEIKILSGGIRYKEIHDKDFYLIEDSEYGLDLSVCEITGNIYDNPELLKGE